jgi:hypothetical protein
MRTLARLVSPDFSISVLHTYKFFFAHSSIREISPRAKSSRETPDAWRSQTFFRLLRDVGTVPQIRLDRFLPQHFHLTNLPTIRQLHNTRYESYIQSIRQWNPKQSAKIYVVFLLDSVTGSTFPGKIHTDGQRDWPQRKLHCC